MSLLRIFRCHRSLVLLAKLVFGWVRNCRMKPVKLYQLITNQTKVLSLITANASRSISPTRSECTLRRVRECGAIICERGEWCVLQNTFRFCYRIRDRINYLVPTYSISELCVCDGYYYFPSNVTAYLLSTATMSDSFTEVSRRMMTSIPDGWWFSELPTPTL